MEIDSDVLKALVCDIVDQKLAQQDQSLEQRLQENRDKILDLAARYGAYNIRLFGSVARGQAGLNSDIDFLVNMQPGSTLFEMGGLRQALQMLLGCPVDVVTEEDISKYIRKQVMAEAAPL